MPRPRSNSLLSDISPTVLARRAGKVQCLGEMPWVCRATAIDPTFWYNEMARRKSIPLGRSPEPFQRAKLLSCFEFDSGHRVEVRITKVSGNLPFVGLHCS